MLKKALISVTMALASLSIALPVGNIWEGLDPVIPSNHGVFSFSYPA